MTFYFFFLYISFFHTLISVPFVYREHSSLFYNLKSKQQIIVSIRNYIFFLSLSLPYSMSVKYIWKKNRRQTGSYCLNWMEKNRKLFLYIIDKMFLPFNWLLIYEKWVKWEIFVFFWKQLRLIQVHVNWFEWTDRKRRIWFNWYFCIINEHFKVNFL